MIWHLTIAIFSLALIQCGKHSDIENTLNRMKSESIVIDLHDYKVWHEPKNSVSRYKHQVFPTYLMYVDSVHCSPCKLSNLPCLDDYRKEVETKFGHLNFLVIYEPSSSDSLCLNDFVDTSSFSIPVYKDINHVFRQRNKHIPDEDYYHDFLLDKNGQIKVVGSPIVSKKIEKVFMHTLNSLSEDKQSNVH